MKNFKLFEKLWEHGRTLRRVGLVLVMCLIAISQMWAYTISSSHIYYDNSFTNWSDTYIQVFIEKDGDNGYCKSSGIGMSHIAHTDLFYVYIADWNSNNQDALRFAQTASNDWGFEERSSWARVSGAYCSARYEHQNLANWAHIFKNSSNTAGANIARTKDGANATAFNHTVTVGVKTKVGNNAFSSSVASVATISMQNYTFNSTEYGVVQDNYTTSVPTLAKGSTTTYNIYPAFTSNVTYSFSNLTEGYYFVGWYDGSGNLLSSDPTYTKYTTENYTIYAYFAEAHVCIEGRFHVTNSSRNGTWTNTFGSGDWDESSTRIKFDDYDGTKKAYYLHTYATPHELSTKISNYDPVFYIKISSSGSSVTDAVPFWSSSSTTLSAANTKRALTRAGSVDNDNLKFSSSDDSGYAILYFDESDIWYELEQTLEYSAGTGSGTAPASRTYYNKGTNATAAENTFTAPSGYHFHHWRGSDGNNYAPGANVPMNSNITLTAIWALDYPTGYIYITDVMATPATKAGTTITATKNSANYKTALSSTFNTNRVGYEEWAITTGSGNYNLAFSSALDLRSYSGGVDIDVWWGANGANRPTYIKINGGSQQNLDEVTTSEDRNQIRKATFHTDVTSLSSIQVLGPSSSGSNIVWFRIGIKETATYALTYDDNTDAEVSNMPTSPVNKPAGTITLASEEPTRSGYAFQGWTEDALNAGTVYAAGGSYTMPASAQTLYAKWAQTYTLTYDDGDGSGAPSAEEHVPGSITLSSTEPTRSGYVFLGWTVHGGDGTLYAAGESYTMPSSDVTLDAEWEEICFQGILPTSGTTVSFGASSTTYDISTSSTVTSGGAITIVNNAGADKNYSFSSNGMSIGTTSGYIEFTLPTGVTITTGTKIRVQGTGKTSSEGLAIIDDSGTAVASQTGTSVDFTYTLASNSAIKDKGYIRINRVTGSSAYIKSVTVTGCGSVSCSAPTSPTITGTTSYTAGDNISLTASATGTSGSTTYTWYKGATWDAASVTSSIGSAATYTKASCVVDDAGTYWCNISNGDGCDVQVSKTITVACASHSVILNNSGSVTGGTFVTSSATVCVGETATLTATPSSGYTFTSWSATGTGSSLSSTTTNPTTLTMGTADVTVNATFTAIPVATITLNKTETTLTYGGSTETLSVTSVLPANALDKTYTWSSSNDAVATVTSGGVVSPVAAGSCNIYATANDGSEVKGTCAVTVNKADLSVTATAGTATSVTHNSATLPFTMTGTTGVASVTLNIYLASDDSFVKSVTGVTAATSGSGEVTGLSAETEYYFTVTPIGDANHNNGSESSKSSTFTTEEAPTLTALVADELYQAADMANITFTEEDQAFTDLSSNSLFMIYGATSPTNYAAKGKNENHSVTDDISTKNFTSALYILSNSNTTSTDDPTQGAIEIITPSTAGLLYLYLDANNSSLTLKKKGTNTSTSLSGATYKAMEVDANTHYFINGSTSGKRGLYGIQYVSTYAVTITPTDVTKETGDGTAIKGKAYTATFTAKDGYELPDDATVTIASSPATKGSEYTWSVTDGTATLTIGAAYVTGAISISVSGVALETHTITYNAMGGSVDPASETVATATLPTPTHDDYEFDGWYTTAGTKITGTYHPTADITLYAKWKGECAVTGVLFSQNFGSATELAYTKNTDFAYNTTSTYSNLVGSGANLFTSLTMDGASSSGFAINSTDGQSKANVTGQFQAYKSNSSDGYWSIVRTGKLANTAPTALKVEMDIWYNVIGSGSYVGVNFAIGNGFSDGLKTSSPQSTSYVHSGFGITNESTPKFCVYNTYDTKIYNTAYPKSGWQSIVWIINNTGETLTYDNPTGSGTSTVNDDCFDLWMKTQAGAASTYTRIVAGQAAISGNVDLQNIHIGSNSGSTNEFRLDNVVITDMNATCFTVTYDGNGSTSGYTNDPAQHTPGSDVTVMYNDPTTGFKRTGYEFNGWNTEADASGTHYDYWDIDHRTIEDIAADVDLYAEWRIVINADNTDFAGKDAPTEYKDVVVRNGATLTITKDTELRDITVETGSTLNVSTNSGSAITLTANSLSLVGGWGTVGNETKYDMPRVYINPASKIERTDKTINFDINVDNRNYYPIALPFEVSMSDVTYKDDILAAAASERYGSIYAVKTYNGQNRADGAYPVWRLVSKSETLKPGHGYILCAVPALAWGHEKEIIRFPMKNVADEWLSNGELGHYTDGKSVEHIKDTVHVTAYKKEEGETAKSNIGWNLLGVPYMSCYTSNEIAASDDAALITGQLDINTGKYKDGDDNIYVSVPTYNFSEYVQENINDAVLLPGWCFFIQVEESGTLTFDKDGENLPIYAPKREKAMPTVKTGIILSGAGAKDKTTILVSDKYNAADYEINADLEKLFGEESFTLATYSLSGETRLAYNALSNADAANIIPIGYRAPADGEYTFSINPRYAENGAFEHVNLIDYETGIMTDLLMGSYTFSTERTQLDTRFALNVVPRQNTPTDIETVGGEGFDANAPRKVLINDKMYIIVDGKMYDATGKSVK